MFLSALLLFFLYCQSLSLGSSNAVSQYQLQNDTLSTCLVLSDGSLLIGTTSNIIKLNSDSLTVSSSLPLNTTTNQLLLLLNDTGFSQNVLSCQEQECFLLDPNDLTTVSVSTSPSPSSFLFPATPDMPGLFTEGRNFFVGKDAASITSSISKLRYSSSGSQLEIVLVGSQQERDINLARKFLTNFQQNEFVYYVFVLPGSDSSESKLQIARICSNDTGIEELSMLTLTTYTEAELQCNEMMTPDSFTAATFVQYNGESMIMVSMRSGSTNIICAFNVSEINTRMNDKLSSCKNGQGTLSLKRNSGSDPCPTNLEENKKIAITVCNRPGQFIVPFEVDDPTVGVRVAFTSQVSSLNSLVYEDIVYLYAGSDQTIEQFYFNANNSLIPIRNITLTANEQVDKIGFSSDSEYLYVQSESYVVKRPVNVCNNFTSCDSCVESGDPICGWCVLSSSCTKLDDCTTSPAIWQKTSSNCPRINDVSPSVIYTDQLMTNTLPMLSLNVSNIPGVISYSCVYNFGSEAMPNTTTTASIDNLNETVTCDLPPSSELPRFNEEDTILSVVSLTANGVTIISLTSEQQISFTNCSIMSSCSSCLNTRQACNWCPFDNNCISPHLQCQGSLNGTAIDNCPLIRSPPNNLTDYLVHVNLPQHLVIEANNLQVYNDQSLYTVHCILKDNQENVLYNLTATVGARNVTCDRSEFNVSLNAQTQLYESTLEVRVSFSAKSIIIDNLNDSKVIFYSCSLMGENCGQCLSIESKFQCGYCRDHDSCIPVELSDCQQPLQGINSVNQCDKPLITDFSPIAGPIRGGTYITIEGTNLGADVSQVASILIGTVVCEHIVSQYMPGKRIVCRTSSTETGVITKNITISFSYDTVPVSSRRPFQFLLPNLIFGDPADPSVGPLSGGTLVNIKGVNLGIGNKRSITLAGQPCAIEGEAELQYNATEIKCISQRSPSTTTRGQGTVRMVIDSIDLDAIGFDYENDPEYESIEPLFFFRSGGTNFTVTGKDLNIIQRPQLIVYYQSINTTTKSLQSNQTLSNVCDVETNTMTCTAPALRVNATDVSIGLLMDNVTELLNLNVSLTLYPDPTFATDFIEELRAGDVKNLTFNGVGFNFEVRQVSVKVGQITCMVKDKTETTLRCEVEIPSTASSSDQYSIRVILGNYNEEIGVITITTPPSLLIIVGPPFAAFVIIIIVIFMVLFSVFYHKYRQKDEQNDRLVFELERLESSVAYECKLGFAELQTDLGELVGDLTGTRLPYHNLHSYLLQSLFPGSKDHPTLHPPQFPSSKKERMETGTRMFYGLLMDKIVLLNIVHTLEAQKQFNIRDKSNFGSLLMIALHNRLDYATEILKRLLSDLVRRTVAESYPKLLLRRTESVAEKMLSSWLAFTLHGYVVEHTGQPLYLLYKAVKAQLEKGPIDVITGEARYSLSEQKLVRQQLDIQVINSTIETEDGLLVPVKLVDCDSISQAKEKMLDAVFKNAPVSQRPQLSSVDIEYRISPTESHILRDEDGTNMYEYGWRRINTLRHYRVQDRATFRLLPRKETPGPGRVFDYTGSLMVSHGHRTRTLSDAEDGTRIWHLFKQVDEDPRSLFTNKKMVTEIYLPRMLSTKTILQQFVDDLFSSIFTLSHPPISPSYLYTPVATTFATAGGQMMYAPGSESLPLAIKYIFDLLDDEAMCAKINDTDVVHTWKNNALALRFWVNLIKNPEFVFDINKSAIVDSCLSVIAQAFIDGCSSSDTRPTINSPTSKLLYNKEVQDYKNSVKLFYEEIQALPRIPDDIMMQHLKEMSAHQAELFQKSHNEFNIESAAYEILRYATKYQQQILQSLRASGLEAKAQIFESVLQYTM